MAIKRNTLNASNGKFGRCNLLHLQLSVHPQSIITSIRLNDFYAYAIYFYFFKFHKKSFYVFLVKISYWKEIINNWVRGTCSYIFQIFLTILTFISIFCIHLGLNLIRLIFWDFEVTNYAYQFHQSTFSFWHLILLLYIMKVSQL